MSDYDIQNAIRVFAYHGCRMTVLAMISQLAQKETLVFFEIKPMLIR